MATSARLLHESHVIIHEISNGRASRILRAVAAIGAESLYNTESGCSGLPGPFGVEGAEFVTNLCPWASGKCPCQALPGAVGDSCAQTPQILCRWPQPVLCNNLTINWMKTQEYVYQWSAQMKLRVGNMKTDSHP